MVKKKSQNVYMHVCVCEIEFILIYHLKSHIYDS